MNSENNTLGKRIMNRRIELEMSQSDLAAEVGISIPSISKIENNHSIPRTKTLEKIAVVLGVSVDYLNEGMPDDSDLASVPFVAEAFERGGKGAARQVQALIKQSVAMLAGGQLSQKAKDSYYRAITDAYFDCKAESERRNSKK